MATTEPSMWEKLKSGIAGIGEKVKSALPKTAATDGTQLRQSLSLPSDGAYTASAGRRRKTRKGGKKSRKTRRKH